MRSGEGDPAGREPDAWLADLEIPIDLWANFSPDRPRVLHALDRDGVRGGDVPDRPARPRASCTSTRGVDAQLNPVLAGLEPDVEGLIVNRLAEPPIYVIAPIDRCCADRDDQARVGGDLRRRRRRRRRSRASSSSCAARWRRSDRASRPTAKRARGGEPAVAGGPRWSRSLTSSSRGAGDPPRRGSDARARPPDQRRQRMRDLHDRADDPADDRAGAREYDAESRERLVELFGAPERWAVTTRSLVWSRLDVLVPAFTGTTSVTVPIACHYDLELAAAKYLHSIPDGEAPLALHFNGTIYYRNERGELQIGAGPVDEVDRFPDAVAVWRRRSSTTTRTPPGWGCARRRSRRCSGRSWRGAWRRSTRAWPDA